jgi:tetratricopeptide (TPR) repeat protein
MDRPADIDIHGTVYGLIVGDNNTVTLVFEGGQRQTVPFLAPTLPTHDLIGREPLQREVSELLLRRYVALLGIPGVGKTALALALAHDTEIHSRFPDGVLWAGLGQNANVMSHLSAWAAAVGMSASDFPKPATVENWARAVHAAIGMRKMLLVIDDAWSTSDALALRLGGPRCGHILTTRIPSLAMRFAGTPTQVTELRDADGLTLLSGLAPDAAEEDPVGLEKLVRLVGGLPLALILIGSYLRMQGFGTRSGRVQTLLAGLQAAEQRFALSEEQGPLDRHPSLPLERPISLLAAIDISNNRLPLSSQRLLRDLAVFPPKPNTFSAEAATAIAEATAEAADELIDAGLVEPGRNDRYSLHQTIYDYARTTTGPTSEVERRMVLFYTNLIGKMSAGNKITVHNTAQFDEEFRNVLFAFQLAHITAQHNALLAAVQGAYSFFANRGLYELIEPHLENALDSSRILANTPAEAGLLMRLGSVVQERGDLVRGEQYLVDGLNRARVTADAEIVADTLIRLGWLAGMRGDMQVAYGRFSEALNLVEGQTPNDRMSAALQGLGWVAELRGNHAGACQFLERSLELARRLDDLVKVGDVLQVMAWIKSMTGEYRDAERDFRECLAIARQLNIRSQTIDALHGLGWIQARRGRYADAHRLLDEAHQLAHEIDYHEIVPILVYLGWTSKELGDYDSAENHLHEAVRLADVQGRLEKLSDALRELGRLEIARSEHSAAERDLRKSLDLAQDIGAQESTLGALHALAELMIATSRFDEASSILERALTMETGVNDRAGLAHTRLQLGEINLASESLDEAVKDFGVAAQYADESGREEISAMSKFGIARIRYAQGSTVLSVNLAKAAEKELSKIKSLKAIVIAEWLDLHPASGVI